MSEFNPRTYAASRGLEDAKAANAATQATGQSLIIINGGAATATLTFAAAGSPPVRIETIVIGISLIFFALGVVFAANYMGYQGRRLEHWSQYWDARAEIWDKTVEANSRQSANDLDKKVGFAFRWSVRCFVIGIGTLGLSIIKDQIFHSLKESYPTAHFWF